jgi:KDO2-lipid IV(A) lauroyltransferase
MKRPSVRHRIEYALVASVRGLVRVLPESAARALGALIGWTFYVVDGGHRRLAVAQLRTAFPARSDAECRAIARATFAHFGQLLVGLLQFSRLSPEAMRARVEWEGLDRVHEALSRGRGVLLFTGHFGFWELQGMTHALALPPIALLARPLDNPLLHNLLEDARTRTGNSVIYRRGAVRRVLRALQSNQGVAVLIDQHIQPADAVTVEFFGRPVSTTSALATLALRTSAALVPVFGLPLGGGRYRMIYDAPVELPPADSPDPVRELTQRCTDVLEMYVRRHPHLWLWMHRRWRETEVPAPPVPGMFPSAAADEPERAE